MSPESHDGIEKQQKILGQWRFVSDRVGNLGVLMREEKVEDVANASKTVPGKPKFSNWVILSSGTPFRFVGPLPRDEAPVDAPNWFEVELVGGGGKTETRRAALRIDTDQIAGIDERFPLAKRRFDKTASSDSEVEKNNVAVDSLDTTFIIPVGHGWPYAMTVNGLPSTVAYLRPGDEITIAKDKDYINDNEAVQLSAVIYSGGMRRTVLGHLNPRFSKTTSDLIAEIRSFPVSGQIEMSTRRAYEITDAHRSLRERLARIFGRKFNRRILGGGVFRRGDTQDMAHELVASAYSTLVKTRTS